MQCNGYRRTPLKSIKNQSILHRIIVRMVIVSSFADVGLNVTYRYSTGSPGAESRGQDMGER